MCNANSSEDDEDDSGEDDDMDGTKISPYMLFFCSPCEGGFQKTKLEYCDPSLTKIYAMDYSSNGNLLVCGGHGGQVSIFGTRT